MTFLQPGGFHLALMKDMASEGFHEIGHSPESIPSASDTDVYSQRYLDRQ